MYEKALASSCDQRDKMFQNVDTSLKITKQWTKYKDNQFIIGQVNA